MSLRAKKKMASKLAKTAKGEEMIQNAMGADGVALLKAVNATATAKYGAKEAKTLKTDLYTMMMKFQIHAEEGLQDAELRAKSEEQLNLLLRQLRVALTESISLEGKDLQAAEAAGLASQVSSFRDSLVALSTGNMTTKNTNKLKSTMDRIGALCLPLLFDQGFAEPRAAVTAALEKVYIEALKATGDKFEPDGTEEDGGEGSSPAPGDAKAGGGSFGGQDDSKGKGKPIPCAIPSCGRESLYATATFRGSPFCALHHFKKYSEFNGKGDPLFDDWMASGERRASFRAFLAAWGQSARLGPTVDMYEKVKLLQVEQSGAERARLATSILDELVKTAGDKMGPAIVRKIRGMISPGSSAPNGLFDSLLPRLEESCAAAYAAFRKTSAFKLDLQTTRLPEKEKEELAWQIAAESHTTKGATIGFAFKSDGQDKKQGDDAKDEKKRGPAPIDTNAVLQPFAVEKDRSPTIRRVRPGEEEPDPELPNGELRPEEKEQKQTSDNGGENGDADADADAKAETGEAASNGDAPAS